MFPKSTQQKHWMFRDEQELALLRRKGNASYVERFGSSLSEDQRHSHFLSTSEERTLLRQYELQLREFCRSFSPPMPPGVIGTSHQYFKRFYLNNSIMDYHPKEILVTCVYLACKVEEFNVSIAQFVANTRGDREKAMDIILNNELLLMQQLKYHLAVHNPYRAVEGLLIDIKTRCKSLQDPEQLRPGIEDFLTRVFYTDACLTYAPSQLALAAVLHAASKKQHNLDAYVTDTLFGQQGKEKLGVLVEAVRKVRSMVKSIEPIQREAVRAIERKLERCRNQDNNPDSQAYRKRQQELVDEEGDRRHAKYLRDIQGQRRVEEKLLNETSSASSSPL